jgi:hypothetical protein
MQNLPTFGLAIMLLVLHCCGCSRDVSDTAGHSSGVRGLVIEVLGKKVTAATSPTDVAQLGLSAIEADDVESLTRLVAAEHVKADVGSITQGRAAFDKIKKNAPRLSAQAIATGFVGMNPPFVARLESIQGTRATVVVSSSQGNQTHERNMYLVREDGLWRLVPSHR